MPRIRRAWHRTKERRRNPTLILRVEPPELLNALPGVHLGGIDVPLVIDSDVVQRCELPGLAADATESPHDLLGAVVQDADFAVGAIGHVDEFLLLVRRKHQLVDRAGSPRVLLIEMLGHERAILAEDLETVDGAVADIDKTVLVEAHAVDRIAGLGGRRLRGIVGRRLLITRLLAVSTPVALVSASFGIEYDNPAIGVSVGGKHLLGDGIDRDIGWRAEPLGRIAVVAGAGFADLEHELAIHREFKQLAIRLTAAGEPDEIVVVDENTMLRLRPFIAGTRTAPRTHEVAGLVKYEHGWRRDAAPGRTRILLGCPLSLGQRIRALDDPDAIKPIDRDAGDLTKDPVVRKRLRPQCIDLKLRNGCLGLLCRRCARR